MKKLLVVLLVLALSFSLVACSTEQAKTEEPKAEEAVSEAPAQETEAVEEETVDLKGKKIGFVNAGPDDYYSKAIDVFTKLANEYNWEVTVVSSDYTPQKEIDNVNDMIVAGYDAIAIISATQVSATEACVNANDAGVPIFFGIASPLADQCDPDGMVYFDLFSGANDVAKWVAANYPDAENIYTIDGGYGQGMAEAQMAGFEAGLEEAGLPAFISLGTGEWQREPAMMKAQDFIAKGDECDILFTGNEEMAAGIVQAYEEAQLTPPPILATNGKEAGIELIKAGTLKATSPNPPSLIADLMIQQMIKYFSGEEYVDDLMVLGAEVIDGNNVGNAIPWIADNYMEARSAGTFKYDLAYYEEQLNK